VSPENEHDGPFQYAFNVKDGQTAFDWWSKDPVLSENFNTFMTGTGTARSHWVNWLPVQELLSEKQQESDTSVLMVDIGGGKGHDMVTFLRKFPDAKGRFILEDLPNVIDDYDPKEGHERIECIKCDMRLSQPVKGSFCSGISLQTRLIKHDQVQNSTTFTMSSITGLTTLSPILSPRLPRP
jgi:hypothetical protein